MVANAEFWLSKNLRERFSLPDDAAEWIMSLWNAIQIFDDMWDGDMPDRDKLLACICDTLCNMPANPFFQRHMSTLLPLMAVAILKWKGADDAERAGNATETSFVWRAGFYDIVLAAIQIVHGQEVASDAAQYVMQMYGERYADYLREMNHA